MININELRTGNWFKCKVRIDHDEEMLTVKAILPDCVLHEIIRDPVRGFKHNVAACSYDVINPIALSPEILKKCGFEPIMGGEEHDDPDYEATGWRIAYPASYMTEGVDHFCIWDDKPGYLMDNYSSAPLRYLHQLQNLYFALTGEELKLKEPV